MKKIVKLLLIISIISNYVFADTENKSFDFKIIDEIVKEEMEAQKIPGVSIGIVKGDEIVYLKGYGKDSRGNLTSPQTKFFIGSCSKSFTAMAIMQLAEKGKLSLDKPVKEYLNWFSLKDNYQSDKITLRNLLSQTSGISTYSGRDFYDGDNSITDKVRFLKKVELSKPVGSEFQYSNLNYFILGIIIEEVAGVSYEEYVKENILIPLKMNNTFANIDKGLENDFSTGFQPVFGKLANIKQKYFQGNVPAAYIISNAEDIAHYLIMQNNDGIYENSKLISAKGISQMHNKSDKNSWEYGMGWVKDGMGFSHGGDVEGFHADMKIIPSSKMGVVVLMNTNDYVVPALTGKYNYANAADRIMVSILENKKIGEKSSVNIDGVYSIIDITLICMVIFLFYRMFCLRRFAYEIRRKPKVSLLRIIFNYSLAVLLFWGIQFIFDTPYKTIIRFVPGIGHIIFIGNFLVLMTAIIQTIIFIIVKINIKSKK